MSSQTQEHARERDSRYMHSAIRDMIDRFGVTPACLEFFETDPLQYINGRLDQCLNAASLLNRFYGGYRS